MISLEHYEIAEYLYNYANLNYLMLSNPNKSVRSLFQDYMDSKNIEIDYEKYYKAMLNIYVMFLKMKTYSICEDYNLKNKNNFVNNENLDLTNIKNTIIVDGDFSNISDKRLLQLIKDAFCHSNSNNQLYHISPNGRLLEFKLQKPSPITIKLKLNDIISLNNIINDNTQTVQLIGFEWDNRIIDLEEFLSNLKINRYHFTKKMDRELVDSIHEYSENGNYSEAISEAENFDNCVVKELKLTEKDIDEILDTINLLVDNNTITEEEYNDYFCQIINILIGKKFPLPVFKADYYTIDSFMIYYLQSISDFSYNDTYTIISKLLPEKEEKKFNFEKHYERLFDNPHIKLLFRIYYGNFDEKVIYSYMIFIEYIISNYCCDREYIKIGKRSVLANKLRNSLVHARWCIDGNKILFYDALPNIVNELEYNWKVSINFSDLCDYCIDILENQKNKEREKKIIKTVKINS